jgi:hypothetical protein
MDRDLLSLLMVASVLLDWRLLMGCFEYARAVEGLEARFGQMQPSRQLIR